MADPMLTEPISAESEAPLTRLLKAVLRAVLRLPEANVAEEARCLKTGLDDYSAYLDHTWPASRPSDDGSQARNREARLREKVIRSRARVTAANNWATVAVKASAVLVSLAIVLRLFGV